MIKTTMTLPEGYEEFRRYDLAKDKKLNLLINALGFLLMMVMVIPLLFPIPPYITFSQSVLFPFDKLVFALLAVVAYVYLHEFCHGQFIRLFTGQRAVYGMRSGMAYAGSRAYINKLHYVVIALAPVLVFGIIFAVALLFIPASWFWVVYLVQVMNVGGAAGDYYMTVVMLRMPPDVLVNDMGTSMVIYAPKQD